MRPLMADDPVVTPSGRRAIVQSITDGMAEVIYMDTREPGLVKVALLRRIEPGRALPMPVRVLGRA